MSQKTSPRTVPALKVRQWLADWDEIEWSPEDRRAEPQHWFYQFSMPAAELKALSGIYPRTTERGRAAQDLGIQRRHDVGRSKEISRFVRFGFPWSELSDAKRESGEFNDLRQPGWLPTAIVVNFLQAHDTRRGKCVAKEDLITVADSRSDVSEVRLPASFDGKVWRHTKDALPPIEVIDGQHRLWAFDQIKVTGDFELPVVAFVGLDLSWQAYLFYTINIKPKRINASLAFDLYPLLRTEEWLNKFEGHVIYRETRAQDLVDMLWSHSESPWRHRINMLGETQREGVTQAAWVRSLLTSFVKSWKGRGVTIGGLFGSKVGEHQAVLPWSRSEQAAFLIVVGQVVKESIANVDEEWAEALREDDQALFEGGTDLAFTSPNSLLNQDQGLRVLLQVVNDVCYLRADDVGLGDWGEADSAFRDDDEEEILHAVKSLRRRRKIVTLLRAIGDALAAFDWRASSTPGLSETERVSKAAFRGSGGYKELRKAVLQHIEESDGDAAVAAGEILAALGY